MAYDVVLLFFPLLLSLNDFKSMIVVGLYNEKAYKLSPSLCAWVYSRPFNGLDITVCFFPNFGIIVKLVYDKMKVVSLMVVMSLVSFTSIGDRFPLLISKVFSALYR
jgi:hypothetical protein